MSTIKISQLTELTTLNANTANTVFVGVDVPSGITARFSATTLSQKLYANNILNVGDNTIILPNVVAQFTGTSDQYIQTNLQNDSGNGSADYVVTADIGTDTTWFIDTGIQGSSLSQGILYPLDGYVLVAGNTAAQPGGNLTIGTITTGKNLNITLGGYNSSNLFAQFIQNTGFKLNQKPIIFADGSSQNTAAWTAIQSQASFDQANTNASQIVAIQGVNTTQNTNITSVNNFAAGAYNKANNALANTTGTFAGDLTVTGNVTSKYALTVNNPSMPGNTQYIVVTGTSTGAIGTPSNPGYSFHSAMDGGNRVVSEAYTNSASDYPAFIGRRARGTAASPSAIQTGDTIVRFGGNGYGATKFSQFADARIEFIATENHTDSAKGTKIRFLNTENGTNTATEIATFNANSVTFTGTVSPQKGFIFTPNVQSTLTTLSLDFARDSLIKFNVNDNATITLTNFTYGKVVDVWITNSAAQNKTITHGCLANNSTTKLTTFTIGAQSCAYLKYFSIDGDQSNTFVSIVA